MNRDALRNLLVQTHRNWSRGTPDNTRMPQDSLERHLANVAEQALPRVSRPGHHRGRRARVSGFPFPHHL